MIFTTDAATFGALISVAAMLLSHGVGYTLDIISLQASLAQTKMATEHIVNMLLFSEKWWVCRYDIYDMNSVFIPSCVYVTDGTDLFSQSFKGKATIRDEISPGPYRCNLTCIGTGRATSFEDMVGCKDTVIDTNSPIFVQDFRVCLADASNFTMCEWANCELVVWR